MNLTLKPCLEYFRKFSIVNHTFNNNLIQQKSKTIEKYIIIIPILQYFKYKSKIRNVITYL